jgi:hypothetical protein
MKIEYLYPDNVRYRINEEFDIPSSKYNFNRTGGSKQKGVKGLIKSLPSFILTSVVSWPVSLLMLLGTMSYRWQKRWEDRDAKRQMLLPTYWTDYLANTNAGKSNKDRKNDTHDEKSKSLSTLTGAAGGALAGSLLADKVKELKDTPENRKSKAFVEYWVTLSNGEIVRVRGENENDAKEAANAIIKYTDKSCYDVFNRKIRNGCPKYKFYLDSGEIVYWSAIDKKSAMKEAIETRKDLAEIMNKEYSDLIGLEPLVVPTKVVKSETKKGQEIEKPKMDTFLSISTIKPDFKLKSNRDKLLWELDSLKQFKASFVIFPSIYFPSENYYEAETVIKEFFNHNRYIVNNIINKLRNKGDVYTIKFVDGDIYYVPGNTENDAISIAKEIHDNKYRTFDKVFVGTSKDDYDEIIKEYPKNHSNTIMAIDSVKVNEHKDFKIPNEYNKVRVVEYGDKDTDGKYIKKEHPNIII